MYYKYLQHCKHMNGTILALFIEKRVNIRRHIHKLISGVNKIL